jgi:nucleoid-associated protein YgaU
MAGTIGIKIANGEFFPIMAGNSTVKKRLVLTTVHDEQETVQIDLFRSVSESMSDAQFIGNLMVENIQPRPRGEPSIELVLSSGTDGNITADACDLDIGADSEHHVLNVSLKTINSAKQPGKTADFDIENKSRTTSGLYQRAEVSKNRTRKAPWLILICATLFVLLAVALLWFFFLGGRDSALVKSVEQYFSSEQVAPPPPPPPPPRQADPPPVITETPEEPPVIQAPVTPPPARPVTAERKRPPAPVSSYKVPAVIPKDGAPYRIRWGDTLWDISEAFYRDPWLYPRIARYNNIRNPDLIISGRTIRVPPKN